MSNNNTFEKGDNRPIKGQTDSDRIGGEIINTLETIESDYSRFKDTINNLKNNLQNFMENTSYELGEVKQKTEQKAEKQLVEEKVEDVEEDIFDVDERLNEVMREVGFGEEIEVSNIPPILLEDIYQKILDDLVHELRENLGNHEANQIIQKELENMRMRTSGSELFQYDSRDINIRNLVTSIENNLISPKQIHSTFLELVQKLSEKMPNYKPRNFRAMVNAEGLEFVIKKTTYLLNKTSNIEDNLLEVTKNVEKLGTDLDSKFSHFNSRLSDIEEKIEEEITNQYTDLDYRLSEMEEMLDEFNFNQITEGFEEIRDKNEQMEEMIKNKTSDLEMNLSIVQDDIENLKKDMVDEPMTEDERFVFYAIPDDGATFNKLEKEIGKEVDDIQSKLDSLLEKGKVKDEKRGRWTVYVRSEEGSSEEEIQQDEEEILEESEQDDQELRDSEEADEEPIEEITKEDFSGIIFDEAFTKVTEEKSVDEGLEEESDELEEESDELEEEIEGLEEESDELEEESDLTESEKLIIDEITEDGCTIHHLDKQFEDLDKSDIEEILEKLIEKKEVSTTKRNRWTIYLKQKEVE